MPKKKSSTDQPMVEFHIEPQLMLDVIRAITRFSPNDLNTAQVEFYKSGIIFISSDVAFTSICAIAVSRGALKRYKPRDSFSIGIDVDELDNIKSFCKAGNPIETLEVSYTEPRFDLKLGALTKKVNIGNYDPSPSAGAFKTMKGFLRNLEKIATLKSEDFFSDLKDMSKFRTGEKGDKYYIISKEDKILTFQIELDLGDDAVLETKTTTKKTLKVKLDAKGLTAAIKAIGPFALRAHETITVISADDNPLLLTCFGTDPEQASAFDKELELWYALAPTIVSE